MHVRVRNEKVTWYVPGLEKGTITSGRVKMSLVSQKGVIQHDYLCYGNSWKLDVLKGGKYEGKTKSSWMILDLGRSIVDATARLRKRAMTRKIELPENKNIVYRV